MFPLDGDVSNRPPWQSNIVLPGLSVLELGTAADRGPTPNICARIRVVVMGVGTVQVLPRGGGGRRRAGGVENPFNLILWFIRSEILEHTNFVNGTPGPGGKMAAPSYTWPRVVVKSGGDRGRLG